MKTGFEPLDDLINLLFGDSASDETKPSATTKPAEPEPRRVVSFIADKPRRAKPAAEAPKGAAQKEQPASDGDGDGGDDSGADGAGSAT